MIYLPNSLKTTLKETREIIREIETLRTRPILCLFDVHFPLTTTPCHFINKVLQTLPCSLDLLLESTGGGDYNDIRILTKCFLSHSPRYATLIPSHVRNEATLLALASKEILMHKNAEVILPAHRAGLYGMAVILPTSSHAPLSRKQLRAAGFPVHVPEKKLSRLLLSYHETLMDVLAHLNITSIFLLQYESAYDLIFGPETASHLRTSGAWIHGKYY